MAHILNPNKWIDSYGDYLFSYTRNRVSNLLEAEELVQETLLSAYKGKKNFKGNASEKTWLTSILKRKIIDYYRKRISRKTYSFSEVDSFFTQEERPGNWLESKMPSKWEKNVDQLIENEELGTTLTKCLSKLPPNLYSVFKMKTLDGFDSEEICNQLNITNTNLWVMLHRSRLALRDCIEKNWYKK